MGTEVTTYFRVRCPECKYREDCESMDKANATATEHNAAFHGKAKKAEIGRFYFMEPKPYWGFPA